MLFNGKIVTVDDAFSIREAIVLKDGRILAVPSWRSLLNSRGFSLLEKCIDDQSKRIDDTSADLRQLGGRLDRIEVDLSLRLKRNSINGSAASRTSSGIPPR